MKNIEMTTIAHELITAANLPKNVEIKVLTSVGNCIMLRSFRRSNANSPILGEHISVSQIGYGLRLWGIQGEQRIRNQIAAYIAEVAA